jgi:TolA-binding protein
MFEQAELQLEQKPVDEWLAAAKAFYGKRNYPKACLWLRLLLARGSWDRERWEGEAHYWLGAALVKRRRYREAIPSLLEAKRCGLKCPDVPLRLAEAYQAPVGKKARP